jgi:hypothetical protein
MIMAKLKNLLGIAVIMFFGAVLLYSACNGSKIRVEDEPMTRPEIQQPIITEHEKLREDIVSLKSTEDLDNALGIIETKEGVEMLRVGSSLGSLVIDYSSGEVCSSIQVAGEPTDSCQDRARLLRTTLRDEIQELKKRPM